MYVHHFVRTWYNSGISLGWAVTRPWAGPVSFPSSSTKDEKPLLAWAFQSCINERSVFGAQAGRSLSRNGMGLTPGCWKWQACGPV